MINIETTLSQAVEEHRNNNTNEAELLYRSILEIDPYHPDVNNNLGIVLKSRGQPEESLQYFERAINYRPINFQHLKSYLSILLQMGKMESAASHLKIADRYGLKAGELTELRTMCIDAKIESQNGIPLFYDASLKQLLAAHTGDVADKLFSGFCQLVETKHSRFIDPIDRLEVQCLTFDRNRTVPPEALTFSQGSHSVLKWKEHDIFKSAFDMSMYWMLIYELQPDTIIELGSGSGGSAVWLSDITRIMGLNTEIISYDIKKPNLEYPGIEFHEFDITSVSSSLPFPQSASWKGKKLVIEDAHVNVAQALTEVDSQLSEGDYIVVEDSDNKSDELRKFLAVAKNKYVCDQYYLDFFGINGTSARNSIYRVEN